LKQKAWRIIMAAVIMGVALYFGNALIEGQLGTGLWRRVAVLVSLVTAGGAVYALAILLFGAYRISELKSLFRRRATTPAAPVSE
jgi:putative peptidoglycan lipid II flippase